jgi:tRNA1Val (adenine37-N6)-methyltransferase
VPGLPGHKNLIVPNPYFQFKEFIVYQDHCAMKVTTDSCLFGAWCAAEIQKLHCSKILDIGTGTGLLALMIAQKNTGNIDAVELDDHAARQALENISVSPWKDRISIFKSDILEHVGKYDCIISNPPYYENELQSPELKNNLAHHSISLTLKDIIRYASQALTGRGYFFLILPYKRLLEAEKMLLGQNLFLHKTLIIKQTTNHSPFRVMIMAGKERKSLPGIEVIPIKNGEVYSENFKDLLKDYYLYL